MLPSVTPGSHRTLSLQGHRRFFNCDAKKAICTISNIVAGTSRYALSAPPERPVKFRCQHQLGCCEKWSELLTLGSLILYRVVQDRWFIAGVVGLGALIVVLTAAALFAFSG